MRLRTAGVMVCIALGAFACSKRKVAVATPAAPPPAVAKNEPAPAAAPKVNTFSVYPESIAPGSRATLHWSVSNAKNVTISAGIGSVEPSGGSQSVAPSQTTVYNLTATGPGGSASSAVTLNVAAVAVSKTPIPAKPFGEMVAGQVRDAYFGYNASTITEEAGSALASDAAALKQIFQKYPDGKVMVEGHCDERGSSEYNLALGDSRAHAARAYLTRLGVPETRLDVVSYGKEKPQCTESDESCWAKNRRAHFAAQ